MNEILIAVIARHCLKLKCKEDRQNRLRKGNSVKSTYLNFFPLVALFVLLLTLFAFLENAV